MINSNFYTAYHNTFELVHAHTDELKEQVFRLRYEVYCLENWLLDPSQNPGKLERDVYDEQAEHLLLVHKENWQVIGTARLNFMDQEQPLNSLPLQELCDHPLLQRAEKITSICEISRLCMSRSFRRRAEDGRFLPAYHEPKAKTSGKLSLFKRRIPYAPLGLISGAFEIAMQRGTLDCVWLMDPNELHGLQQIGMDYRVLGPRLSGHGNLQPIIFNIAHVLEAMKTLNEPCWDIVSDHGRLDQHADTKNKEEWHDTIFDQETKDDIFHQLQ